MRRLDDFLLSRIRYSALFRFNEDVCDSTGRFGLVPTRNRQRHGYASLRRNVERERVPFSGVGRFARIWAIKPGVAAGLRNNREAMILYQFWDVSAT